VVFQGGRSVARKRRERGQTSSGRAGRNKDRCNRREKGCETAVSGGGSAASPESDRGIRTSE